jgi:hypothetical protein
VCRSHQLVDAATQRVPAKQADSGTVRHFPTFSLATGVGCKRPAGSSYTSPRHVPQWRPIGNRTAALPRTRSLTTLIVATTTISASRIPQGCRAPVTHQRCTRGADQRIQESLQILCPILAGTHGTIIGKANAAPAQTCYFKANGGRI